MWMTNTIALFKAMMPIGRTKVKQIVKLDRNVANHLEKVDAMQRIMTLHQSVVNLTPI